MATKAKKTTPASAPKTRKTSASPSFREDKKPAIRARQKQKKIGLAWLRPKFSLASLPKPSVLADIGLTAVGIALIFFALIAYGQLRFGEQTIFGNGFGVFATRFFGRTASFGLVVVFFCGLYLAIVRRISSKPFSFNWKLFAAFLGVYLYISWVIQRFNVTGHPFQSVEFGGGLVAAAVDRFSVAAIGTIGTAILLIFLGMLIAFLVWDKSVRLLPENWETKLNFTRKLIRRLKALLLIPDDENVAPETEMRLQLKPLSDAAKEAEEKELSFQSKLKAFLQQHQTEETETDAENAGDDMKERSEAAEPDPEAAEEISSPAARRKRAAEFTPTKPGDAAPRDKDGIIHVRPFATRGDLPPLRIEDDPDEADDPIRPRAGGDPGGTSPAEANRDGDGAGEPAAEAKPAKPKARVFVAPNLERLVADSRRQPDVAHSGSEWTLPDAEVILDPVPENNDNQQDPEFIRRSTEIIEEVLRSQNAPGTVVDVRCGPTFTQFGVQPGFVEKAGRQVRVRVNKIESLVKDLEMNLEVRQLRIEAPIPGKTYIGMQVQNPKRTTVPLRDILGKGDFRKYRNGLPMSLGIDINGDVHCIDLTRMPHLLIAGETGSGKSVCLNVILTNLLMYNAPDKLKLILIDPKRVELSAYAGVPHLLTPVITDTDKSADTLQYALAEMERRNLYFRDMNSRNIQDYNQKYPDQALPYIVIVIDELASLMMTNGPEIEQSVTRLAQMARAMGIHLIVATQRPSREVITGTIKGNLPSRIAFHVPSNVDSQVILDRPGAEHLFGQGDMLLMTVENPNLQRLQGAFVSNKEIQRLVAYWKTQSALTPTSAREVAVLSNFTALQAMLAESRPAAEPADDDGLGTFNPLNQTYTFREKTIENADSVLGTAIRSAIRNRRISATSLVTELEIGYTRASKILYQLEELGIIVQQPDNHASPWRVVENGDEGEGAAADEEATAK